jgi:hypothetical protein
MSTASKPRRRGRPLKDPKGARSPRVFLYLPADLGKKIDALAMRLVPPTSRAALAAELVKLGLDQWAKRGR